MGMISTAHRLCWTMELTDSSSTVLVLRDGEDRRWGWIVNAAAADQWTAHVGAWGADRLPVAVEEDLQSFDDDLAAAKAWVESQLARQWSARPR